MQIWLEYGDSIENLFIVLHLIKRPCIYIVFSFNLIGYLCAHQTLIRASFLSDTRAERLRTRRPVLVVVSF